MRPILVLILLLVPTLGGCLDGSTSETLDAASQPEAAAVVSTVPVELNGHIAAAAVVCPVVTCVGIHPLASERYFDQKSEGGLVGYDLTLEWTASSPTSERLRLGLAVGEGASRKFEFVEGTSPLTLSGDKFTVGAGKTFEVWVWLGNHAPVEVYATPGQDFTIAGTFSLLER